MRWQNLFLLPVVLSSIYWIAAAVCVGLFVRRGKAAPAAAPDTAALPAVSLFKPVYGLEKDLKANLETACYQDFLEYELIFGIQRKNDPALPIVKEIAAASPRKNTRIVVDETAIGNNGKVSNLYNASRKATGDVFVFSDSDMMLAPDYLRTIVAPLADKKTGICCTLYQAVRPENIFEVFELLSYNAEFIVSVVFAVVTKTSIACPGASLAIRRDVLKAAGGLEELCDFLVEDYELGRRVAAKGFRIQFIPYTVRMHLDLTSLTEWWRHQMGWDQKTKSANPSGFFLTFLIRGVPFAIFYTLTGAPYGKVLLLFTIILRMLTGTSNALFLQDRDGIKFIWLLPVRDILGLVVWAGGLLKRTTSWRGRTFHLKNGKLTEERK